MKQPAPGVGSCLPETTRTLSTPAKCSWEESHGTLQKVRPHTQPLGVDIGNRAFSGQWETLTSLLLSVAGLINTFRVFGSLSVEWPGKDGKHPRCPPKGNMPKGNTKHGRVTFFPCYVTAQMLGWYSCMLVTGW